MSTKDAWDGHHLNPVRRRSGGHLNIMTYEVETKGRCGVEWSRHQVCLGYYWYQAYGYADYREACEIFARLQKIGFKPGFLNEYSSAMKREENLFAKIVFDNLVNEGYNLRKVS